MTVLQKYYWNQYQYQRRVKMREISNEELFNLSGDWENATVDTTKYYSNVMSAVEVSELEYKAFKRKGALVQEHNKKYFVGVAAESL